MAKTIFKVSAAVGGLGLSALLQPQVSADTQSSITTIEGDGTFLGKPVKLRGSEPVNTKPITPRSDFEWVQNNGTDLKKVNINGVGRAPNVKLTMHTEKGNTFVGSGAFIGNSTILSVAHNFLGVDPDTKVTRVTVTVGSNSEVDSDWNTTSGYSFDIDADDIHFFDKPSYIKNRDGKVETSPYDLATIHTKIPYQLIVNKLKDNNVNLGTYDTLKLADSDEIARINNRDNVLSGDRVRMYGYPGTNESDQVYFNPKLQQGFLYEVDTTITNTETFVDDENPVPVRFTKLRNTTMGGMSGSNLMNAHGQVIGVHQSATNRNKETDTPENERTWRATQMLLNPQHYQWLQTQLGEDSKKGFVEFEGNRYYYDEDCTFLRNTTKEITVDDVTKTYQFDDRGVATERLESTTPETPAVEEPKPETPSVDTPTTPETPSVDTPTTPETPAVEEPKPETPSVDTPATPETPAAEEPKSETPSVDAPATPETPSVSTSATPETPAVEEPKPETPSVNTPTTPAVEEPKPETPSVDTPTTPTVEEPKDKVEVPKPETPSVDKVEVPKPETPSVDKVDTPTTTETPAVEEPKDKVETPKPETPAVDKVDTPTITETVSETSQEKIPYNTQIVKDSTMLKGERKVIQKGQDGVKDIIRTWILKDKQKSGEPKVTETIKTEPVDEIINVGTREDLSEMDFEKTPSGGRRVVINFYSVAEGKRVGKTRKYVHLLRPTNKTVSQTREKVRESRQNPERTEFAIRKLYAHLKSLSVRRLK